MLPKLFSMLVSLQIIGQVVSARGVARQRSLHRKSHLRCRAALLLALLLASVGTVANQGEYEPATASEHFHFNNRLTLLWYEANRNCRLKKGPHNYFLVQLKDGSDSRYENSPLTNLVRSDAEDSPLFMAKRCSLKPQWFIYDFDSQQYLADNLRFGDAEQKWISLGNNPVRIVKASKPSRHLKPFNPKPRLPTHDQWIKLGVMLVAPVTALVAFLAVYSLNAFYRFRSGRSHADLRWFSFSLASCLVVAAMLLSFAGYVILWY